MLKEADELLEKGDVIQASEKYYKAAEESIKILSLKNNIEVLKEVKSLNRWNARLYFKAIEELKNFYKDLPSFWRSAWILHIEGFHEGNLSKDRIRALKEDVVKIVNLI
jgi:hypothetical protein